MYKILNLNLSYKLYFKYNENLIIKKKIVKSLVENVIVLIKISNM